MNSSIVLVPGAPVLVPELSGAAVAETGDQVAEIVETLREAARGTSGVLVVGADPSARRLGDVGSSLARWGAPVPVGRACAPPARHEQVPDAALIAWWLLDRAVPELPRRFVGIAEREGHPLSPGVDDLVVVVADGPASLTPRAPVPEDPRGVALDAALVGWLRAGGTLPDPGEAVADAVGWWSRPAWRALADLVGDRSVRRCLSWAPFGVGYHCGWWPAVETQGDQA